MFSQHKAKKSLYEIMGVASTATQEDIKNAYRKLCLKFHPDKITHSKLTVQEAEEKFKEIGNAYEVLRDPVKRAEYDSRTNSTSIPPSASSSSADKDAGRVYVPVNHGYILGEWESSFPKDFFHTQRLSPIDILEIAKDIIKTDKTDEFNDFLNQYNLTNPEFFKGSLVFAVMEGALNIVKYLIEVKRINPKFTVLGRMNGNSLQGSLLKFAVHSGCFDLVVYFIEVCRFNTEAQATTFSGYAASALSEAVCLGHLELVRYLIRRGANPNPEVAYSTIMARAIESENFEIIKELATAGSRADHFDVLKAFKQPNEAILNYLLALIGDSFFKNLTKSDLVDVISGGYVEYLKYVQTHSLFSLEKNYPEYLYAAASSGSVLMMSFFMEQACFSVCPYRIEKLLEAAVGLGCFAKSGSTMDRLKVLIYLFEEKEVEVPESVLQQFMMKKVQFAGIQVQAYLQSYLSCYQPYRDVLKHVSINGLDGLPLLTLLRLYNVGIPYKSDLKTYADVILERIAAFPDFDEVFLTLAPLSPQFRQDVLFYLCDDRCGHEIDRLKYLVELGVNINAKNEHGHTPLFTALTKPPGHYNDTVKYLLECGADVHQVDGFRRNPYEFLKDNPHYQHDFGHLNSHTLTRTHRG